MKKSILFYISLYFCVSSTNIFGQYFKNTGTLLRVNYSSPNIVIDDTLGYWMDGKDSLGYFTNLYQNVFKSKNQNFLIKDSLLLGNPNRETIQKKTIEFSSNGKSYFLSAYENFIHQWDYDLLQEPTTLTCDMGTWVFDGEFGQVFITKTDSVINTFELFSNNESRFSHICGQVDSFYLVFREDDKTFRLCDLSNSPYINLDSSKVLSFSGFVSPIKIKHISKDVFLMQDRHRIHLDVYKLNNDTFNFQHTLFRDFFSDWVVNSDTLIYLTNLSHITKNAKIIRAIIDTNNFSFLSSETILEGRFNHNNFDVNNNLTRATYIKNDSLIVYNLENSSILNSWNISEHDSIFRPLASDESVFLHLLKNKTPTNIRSTHIQEPPYNLQTTVYPNPFNSEANIEFTIPKSGIVNIVLYNSLGKLIKVLTKNYFSKGSHRILFNGNSFSSGIYYYQIISSGTHVSNKFILLK